MKISFPDCPGHVWPEKLIEAGGAMQKLPLNTRWSWKKSDSYLEKYPSWEISTICIYRGLLSALSAQSSSMPEMPCMYSPKRSSWYAHQWAASPSCSASWWWVRLSAIFNSGLSLWHPGAWAAWKGRAKFKVGLTGSWGGGALPLAAEGSAPCCCRCCWHSGSVRVILFYKGKHVEDSVTNASIGRSEEKWWKDQLVKTIP